MKLATLFSSYSQYKSGETPFKDIDLLTNNSKEVSESSVFIAIKGSKFDGHSFLQEVCNKKVAAVVISSDENIPPDYKGAVLKVLDTRQALNEISAKFHGHPTEDLFCVGITGTNGKTSVSYLVEKILDDFGWATGVMGTVDHHLKTHKWKSSLTTPDGLLLNKRLAEMKSLKAQAAVFEISSHAIEQKRAHNINLDVAVFTNLTQDHLDYHKNMDDYFLAKTKLFSEVLSESVKKNKYMIINNDCAYGSTINAVGGVKKITFGKKNADITFNILEQTLSGSTFVIKSLRGEKEVFIPQPGEYNVYNAVAAMAVGLCANVSLDSCVESMKNFKGIPGRLQSVSSSKGIHIFVDYAHTHDALISVLKTLNHIKENSKIITVIGCGGDRDKSKRPKMFAAANASSDLTVVTSDNPRSEDPQAIINDMLQGRKESESVIVEVDRKKAIKLALEKANKDDIVLVAGKGHEDSQIIGTTKHPFRDVEVIKGVLK